VSFERLAARIATRQQGRVLLAVDGEFGGNAQVRDPRKAWEEMLRGSRLRAVSHDLLEIDAERAVFIVRLSLQFDLAYNAEVLPKRTAIAAAKDFVAFAGPGARFFTNRYPDTDGDPDRPLGYDRVICSDATFDSLVIAVGEHLTVLLCVLDED
jgi:hypothetical protein